MVAVTPCQAKRIREIIKQLKAREEAGRWITTEKAKKKVFIPDGEDTGEVLEKHFDKIIDKAEKSKPEKTKAEKPKADRYNADDHKKIQEYKKDFKKEFGDDLDDYDPIAVSTGAKDWTPIHEHINGRLEEVRFYKEYDRMAWMVNIDESDLKKFGITPYGNDPTRVFFSYMDSIQPSEYDKDSKKNIEKFNKMWDYAVEKSPDLKNAMLKAEAVAEVINDKQTEKYENNDNFYRGTTIAELDSYVKDGVFGKDGLRYQYTAMSVDEDLATAWIGNNPDSVVISYDGDHVRERSESVRYDAKPQPSGVSFSIKKGSKEDLAKPMSLQYYREGEVRMMNGESIYDKEGNSKISTITFTGISKSSPEAKKLKAKYGKLAPIVFAKKKKKSGADREDKPSSQVERIMKLLGVSKEEAEAEIERWGFDKPSLDKSLLATATLMALNAVESKKVEYYTKDGDFYVKTFLISDKRNKRGWRASWNSIKKNVKSFHGRPGIEYMKCTEHGCDLDHTEGDTKEESIHIQEKYRVSTIVDTVLDESTHTAYAIQKVEDSQFRKKIEMGEIKYLSPSIWPNAEKTTLSISEDNEWYIDTTDWDGLHHAWVNRPAFGHEARVVGQCTGDESCITELKNNRALVARAYATLFYAKGLAAVQKKRSIDKANAVLFYARGLLAAEKEEWITVNGTPVLIEDGQSKGDAIKEKFGEKDKSTKKDSPKTKDKEKIKKHEEKIREKFGLDESSFYDYAEEATLDPEDTVEAHKYMNERMSWGGFHEKAEAEKFVNITKADLKKFDITGKGSPAKQYFDKMNELFRSVNNKKSYEKFSKMWDHAVNNNPSLKEQIQESQAALNILNEMLKYRYENSEEIHRSTTLSELDTYLNEGKLDTSKSEYNYTAASVSPDFVDTLEMGIDDGVVISYNTEAIKADAELANYVLKPQYLDNERDIKKNSREDLKIPTSSAYIGQAEVRIAHNTSVFDKNGKSKISKITFTDVKDKDKLEKYKKKYGRLTKKFEVRDFTGRSKKATSR